jgi:hypothetical protein
LRAKRPYDQLGPTQRWERRQKGKAALADIGVPASALCTHQPTAASLLPISTAERRKFRQLETTFKLPCEQKMALCKRQFAFTHGTQTACFTLPPAEAGQSERVGAYVTNPIRLVRLLSAHSPFVAVGGDKGSSWVKLGVTYQHKQRQRFLPLLIFEGKDNYESLHELRTPNLTCFTEESAHHAHIFSVLQHIIDDSEHSFLNGDWPFISAILAHQGHNAFYPCPICIVERRFLLSEESYRRPTDGNSIHSSRSHTPLLTIPSDRIVPTPLHLYLGISNRIIFNALAEMFTEQQVLVSIKSVKSKHSAGCGGLSDLYSLNGPEIRRFIKRKLATELVVTECRTESPLG